MARTPFLNRRVFLRGSASTAAALGAASIVHPLLAGTARAAAPTPLNFQLSWLRSIQYGGYFAGAETGIYARAGIEPTFTPGGPNIDAIANVASGRASLGDRPVGPIIIAREKGIPIKVIGAVFQKSPFAIMSLETKPIRTLADLAGKTVAVGATARPTMTTILKENGIDPKSVTMVPAAPDPFALVSGQLDAYTGLSTNQGEMLKTRGISIVTLNLYDLGLPETSGVIYGREDFLAANRSLVVSFLKASMDSWRWALAHPEETARLTVDKYGAAGLEYDAQLAEIKSSGPFLMAGTESGKPLLGVDLAAYDRLLDLYRKSDLVKSGLRATDLCDPSFAEEAAKL